MGIAEDLKALEDLHQKGKLTDQEFSDAKATALQKLGQPPVSTPKRSMCCSYLGNVRERYVKCRGYGLGGTGIPRAAHRAI